MKNERGQGIVEFALVLVLVAIIGYACYVIFGNQIHQVWDKITTIASL